MNEQLNVFVIDEDYELEIKEDIIEVNAEEDTPQSTTSEITTDIVEIEAVKEVEISMEETVGWVGGDSTRHYSLYGRDEANQHPIQAITGLRAELDQIESLQTVYSDKKQQADYYLWHQDEIPTNPTGLFVSIYEGTNDICVCDGTTDVFGVTISDAGFIGGQPYLSVIKSYNDINTPLTYKDKDNTNINNYGLVITSGLVSVQCESDVVVGDYVVPNQDGIAEKSDVKYGYLVTTIIDNGTKYAVISLATPSTLLKTLADDVKELDERTTNLSYNLVSTQNSLTATQAFVQDTHNYAGQIEDKVDSNNANLNYQLGQTNDRIDGNDSSILDIYHQLSLANQAIIDKTEEVASDAQANLEKESTAINLELTDLSTRIGKLIEETKDLTTWSSQTGETQGASGFVEQVEDINGDLLQTKTRLEIAETNLSTLTSATRQSSKQLETIVQKIDKYSVGEHSQAYGLTYEQVKTLLNIIPVDIWDETDKTTTVRYYAKDSQKFYGYNNENEEWEEIDAPIIYIPTVDDGHTEQYSTYKMTFVKGYSYIWVGDKWQVWPYSIGEGGVPSNTVVFTDEHILPTTTTPYWVVINADVTVEIVDAWDETDKDITKVYYQNNNKLIWRYNTTEAEWQSFSHTINVKEGDTEVIYDLGGLYVYENGGWVKKASTSGNVLSRAISNIDQTANSIGLNVTALRGDVASLQVKVDENASSVSSITKHVIGDYSLVETWELPSLDVVNIDTWNVIINDYPVDVIDTWDATDKDINKRYYAKDTKLCWYYENEIWNSIDANKIYYTADTDCQWYYLDDKWTSVDTDCIYLATDTNLFWYYKDNAWKSTEKSYEAGVESTLAGFEQKADKDGASIAQIVEAVGDNGEVNAASIVTAINQQTGASAIKLEANNINLQGAITIDAFDSTTKSGLVSSTQVLYARSYSSDDFDPVDGDAGEWSTTAPSWVAGEYMWQKTIITYVNGSTNSVETCIQGARGKDGQEVMTCRIESSAGASFKSGETGSTTLTARLYRGATEIDADGEYEYTWYAKSKDGTETTLGTGKSRVVGRQDIIGKSVYFKADDKSSTTGTAVLALAYLGVMTLGSG